MDYSGEVLNCTAEYFMKDELDAADQDMPNGSICDSFTNKQWKSWQLKETQLNGNFKSR